MDFRSDLFSVDTKISLCIRTYLHVLTRAKWDFFSVAEKKFHKLLDIDQFSFINRLY